MAKVLIVVILPKGKRQMSGQPPSWVLRGTQVQGLDPNAAGLAAPDKLETRFGTLTFKDGVWLPVKRDFGSTMRRYPWRR